jgi:hypothetical protein
LARCSFPAGNATSAVGYGTPLADPITVEFVTATQHGVLFKKVVEWVAHNGGPESQGDGAESAGEAGLSGRRKL